MRSEESSMNSKVVSIAVSGRVECSRGVEQELSQYASRTGLSISSIVDEAVKDWLACVAPAREKPILFSQSLRKRG